MQLMKGFHFPSTRTTNSVRLILGSQYSLCKSLNQTSPLVCFEGWNTFLVPIWSPWEPNLSHRWRGCQLGLLSINSVFLNFFYPVEFNWAKKPTLEGSAWTGCLNFSPLSLFSFSELNKALNTNKCNWWRVFIFLPQELQTRSDLSSVRNILFASP